MLNFSERRLRSSYYAVRALSPSRPQLRLPAEESHVASVTPILRSSTLRIFSVGVLGSSLAEFWAFRFLATANGWIARPRRERCAMSG